MSIGNIVFLNYKYLSYGRNSPVLYSPYTMMDDTPDTDRYYTDGTETKSRQEWQQDYSIFGMKDQELSLAGRSSQGILRLRRN